MQRICLNIMCCCYFFGVAHTQVALASTDNATLHVGSESPGGNCGGIIPEDFGYDSLFGSYSPTGLTGGETVAGVIDIQACGVTSGILSVSGFSSDLGKLWLTSITCNGVTKTASAATNYSYSSGTASWTWSASAFGFSSKVGTNVSCSITHS
jgi:hypothetical protein